MGHVLFTNVRIIDGSGAEPYAGDVLVQGNRIRRVARGGRTQPPAGATVIDGAGATLMPGMCEAHTHFSWNDAATLIEIQLMPLEEHVLWCGERGQALSRGRLHLLRRRGVREAAARRGDPQRHQRRPDTRAALPRRQPGDHGGGRARRRDAAAPALARVQLRRQCERSRGDAQGGAHVPEVRRRHDQAQPLGRQLRVLARARKPPG